MKNFLLVSGMLSLMAISPAFAKEKKEGHEGGGGGGVCIQGKCMTLTEAGFRIKGEESASKVWNLTSAVLAEINNIAATLPFGNAEIKKESVSNSLYKQVLNNYKKTLKETNNSHMIKDLQIFAISTEATTYLLPSFFKLSEKQQALILVHEGIVRNRNQDYKLALKFDGLYLDYLEGKNDPTYSPVSFYKTLANLTNERTAQIPLLVKYIEARLGRKLAIEDLVDDGFHYGEVANVQRDRKDSIFYHPRLIYIADRGMEAMIRNTAIVPEYSEIFKSVGIDPNFSDSNLVSEKMAQETCSNSSDNSYVRLPFTLEMERKELDMMFIDCSLYNSNKDIKAISIVFDSAPNF
jgi:hypothetical protein